MAEAILLAVIVVAEAPTHRKRCPIIGSNSQERIALIHSKKLTCKINFAVIFYFVSSRCSIGFRQFCNSHFLAVAFTMLRFSSVSTANYFYIICSDFYLDRTLFKDYIILPFAGAVKINGDQNRFISSSSFFVQ